MSVIESPVGEVSRARPPVIAAPSRVRYLWAAVVVLVGLTASVQWSFAILRASEAEADTFPRADVPGTLTADLHPGTWYIYEEAGASVRDIRILDPDGAPVAVDNVSKAFIDFKGYDRNGRGGSPVGAVRLLPGSMGEYTITVTGDDEFGDGTFAIGEADIATFRRNETIGLLTMLVVSAGTGIAIAAGTFLRRRATTSAALGKVRGRGNVEGI